MTADADLRVGTRLGVRDQDGDAGELALEGLFGAGHRAVVDGGVVHLGDGGGEVGALHGAVTDDDGLFEHLGVLGEDDAHVGGGGHPLGDVADAGDLQRGTGGDTEGEVAVDVGGDAVGSAGHHPGCADDRYSVGVEDLAGGGLGECRDACEQQSRTGHKRHERLVADRND